MSKVIGLDPQKSRFYIPKCDRKIPVHEQCKFKVRLLTITENAEVRDNLYDVSGLGKDRKERIRSASAEIKILENCLLGWENFKDENGNEVKFEPKNFEYIPSSIRTEIADFCRGEVEEEELKN